MGQVNFKKFWAIRIAFSEAKEIAAIKIWSRLKLLRLLNSPVAYGLNPTLLKSRNFH
jgi:hypothetical protein